MLDRFVNSRLLRGFIVTLLGSGSSKIILVLTTFYATNNLSLLEFEHIEHNEFREILLHATHLFIFFLALTILFVNS